MRRIMYKKTIKWIGIIVMTFIILIFLAMVVAHSIVFSWADYNEYNPNKPYLYVNGKKRIIMITMTTF